MAALCVVLATSGLLIGGIRSSVAARSSVRMGSLHEITADKIDGSSCTPPSALIC